MATMIVLPHMAQLLVCAVPNPGHVFPMMTVSRHLRAAGHKIIFYTAEIFRSKVESCGSSFVSLPGKANYNYLRPDEYYPERNSLPLGSPEWMRRLAASHLQRYSCGSAPRS